MKKDLIPTQLDFDDLIDSMFHNQDKIISQDYGLSPEESALKLITIFKNLNDLKYTWSIEQYRKNTPEFGLNLVYKQGKSMLLIQANVYVDIGTTNP